MRSPTPKPADLDALARELNGMIEGLRSTSDFIDRRSLRERNRKEIDLVNALRNAAPLLLKEREALRAIESELRRTHVRCAENAKSCYWCELLVALDAAREEGAR